MQVGPGYDCRTLQRYESALIRGVCFSVRRTHKQIAFTRADLTCLEQGTQLRLDPLMDKVKVSVAEEVKGRHGNVERVSCGTTVPDHGYSKPDRMSPRQYNKGV